MKDVWSYFLIWFTAILFSGGDLVESELLSDFQENASYIEFAHQPQDTVAVTSKPFILHCEICVVSNLTSMKNLKLAANVTWYKDNQLIELDNLSRMPRRTLMQNGSLLISSAMHNSIHDSDNGLYQCKATYNNKVLISKVVQVNVAVFPLLSHSTVSVSACFSSMVHLSCDFIDADPTPSVSWFRDGHFIGNNSNPHSSATSDLLESSTLLLPNGALQIRNSRPSDSGSFHCTGKNFAGVRQGNQYRVNVSDSSEPCPIVAKFLTRPVSTTAIAGETVFLYCGFNHVASGQIKWLKNDKEIIFRSRGRFKLIGQANLMIELTQLSDAAEYSCVLEGQSPLLASAKLSVQEPPHLLNEPNHLHLAYVGCQISLVCDVGGYPEPLLTWYKNGELIADSSKAKFSDNLLLLTVSSHEDSGIYQCFAQNQAGQIQVSFKIFVVNEDLISESISTNDTIYLESLTTSSASLVWSSFGLSHPTAYTINVFDSTQQRHAIVESENPSYEIVELKANHTIHVVVTPRTRICAGLPSKEITFTIPNSNVENKDMVRNFAVEPMATSVLITWSPPATNLEPENLLYQVVMKQLSDEPSDPESVNTADTSQHFLGLQEYTLYRFQVAVLNPSGEPGPFTQAIETKTLQSAPDLAPSDIVVEIESSDSVLVKWSPPPLDSVNGPICGYQIKYKDLTNLKSYTVNTGAGNTQHRLTDLRKNTRYWLRMQVYNNVSSSPLSRKVNFETPKRERMEKLRPGPPKLLETKPSAREIILMWLPPDDGVFVREYMIGWGESGPYEQRARVGNEAQFYRITDLEPYTQYFISVRAKNKAGMGEEYHTELWTKALDDTPEELYPPLGVHVTVLTHTTLNVSWHDTDRYQKERYYVVRYKTNVPELPRVGYVNSTDVNCIIPGLRPHTVYEVAVRVVQGHRKSTWSMTETAITKESRPGSAPTDLTVMSIEGKPTFVQINWQPPVEPNGELDGYLVFYTTDDSYDIKDWVIEPVVGDKLSTTIEGLTEDTQYYFKALARNKIGVGPYSEVVSYRTQKKMGQSSETVKTMPKSMANWLLYVIIGAVALLVICIMSVSTVLVCRSRKSKAKKSPIRRPNGRIHSPNSGIRSSSGESFPLSVNSAPSGKSVSLFRYEDQVEMQLLQTPDGRCGSEYPHCSCSNANPSELTPLNGASYMTKYPYSVHPRHYSDGMRSPMTSESCQFYSGQAQYMNGNSVQLPNHYHSGCDTSQGEVDYPYPPYTNVHQGGGQQDYAVDSAYGSDHQHHQLAEDNMRIGKISSLRKHKPSSKGGSAGIFRSLRSYHLPNACVYHTQLTFGILHLLDVTQERSQRTSPNGPLEQYKCTAAYVPSERIPSSDSLPSTHSSDDQISLSNSDIANVKDFLRVMNTSDDVTAPKA